MKQKGFTLIELMIVIAIIGILAAVAIPNFMNARDRAHVAAAETTAGAIRQSLEMYMVDNEAYPTGLTAATLEEIDDFLSNAVATLANFYGDVIGYTDGDMNGTLADRAGANAYDRSSSESAYSFWASANDRADRVPIFATEASIQLIADGKSDWHTIR